MARRVMKYNPAFLTVPELIEQFVVRRGDLAALLQTVRDNTAAANQHALVIGPRGSGKTMLVRRLAAEIDRDAELRQCWYPLIFSEESYEVTSPGEFWREAIFHLAQQTQDPRWQAKFDEYGRAAHDEDTLRERALGQLLSFADEQGKRLLLVVENLNMLLGEQVSDDGAWKLRHTLQNEPRIMLLATATSRFEEVDRDHPAMYELFHVQRLRPLDQNDCRVLWHALTAQLLEGDQVRPIQILTGGNLRLLTILSTFAAGLSLREFMHDLVGLVDEHTGYFKSHLDALPPTERKVYLALAERWDPSTAREVAGAARLEVSKTSSLLGRLVERGSVVVLPGGKRTKQYQVAERLYNIYYLFRRRGSPAERVGAVIRFMISFYEPDQQITVAQPMADEHWKLEPPDRPDQHPTRTDGADEMPVDPLHDQGDYEHLVATIQFDWSNLEEAFPAAEKYVADANTIRQTLDLTTNLFTELAARGEGRRALQVLLDSRARGQLEPLVAGIRIFLGEEVVIAQEIKEIGNDVACRIAQRRDALAHDSPC